MNALIITDLQNDFLPGGALAVPHGNEVIRLTNQLQPYFDLVVATQDWHPANHGSFVENHPGRRRGDVIDLEGLPQILWPAHCVQNSRGAEFSDTLDLRLIDRIFHKATDPNIDSYSTFFDNGHRRSTGLADYLRDRGVNDVYLLGLATDYCVRFSAMDAMQLGFNTYVITDASRGIDLHPGDVEKSLSEMRAAGARLITSGEIFRAPKPRLACSFDHSEALFTDLYELTMAQAYFHAGKLKPATFSMFIRNLPRDRGYLVFAGLSDILDYLQTIRFSPSDIDALRQDGRFKSSFLDYLSDFRFTGRVRAMREGTIFFPNEPVLEVTAPMIEAQIIETFLLNQFNLQTLLASKCSRVRHIAPGKQLVDFAARRTQGIDAADKLVRCSYMVGFDGTSNVDAGARYGIPTYGTMAHSFVQSFENEIDAFRAYARSFPQSSTFLVDTYDTLAGTRRAAEVAREMKSIGHHLLAIRLDSGNLVDLSREARSILDQAGLRNVSIFASGGLDEFKIEQLLGQGALIDAFGIGTKIGVSADAPYTDCVYKLVEYEHRPVLKLSLEKQTLPSTKQVYRHGKFDFDTIALDDEPPPPGAQPLLKEVMRNGKRTAPSPSLSQLRDDFRKSFSDLPQPYKRLDFPDRYRVAISETLERLRQTISARCERV